MKDGNGETLHDAELLRAWNGGSVDAGEELYRRYFDIVYRFYRLKVPDVIEDLTQKTMLELHRSHHRYRGGRASFRAFVLGIARHVLLHHLRSKRNDYVDPDPSQHSHRDVSPDAFDLIETHQRNKLLVKALRRIPIDHQIVLELHYWEGMNASEIGVVLETPSSTIRSKRRVAYGKLRTVLVAMLDDPTDVETTLGGLSAWVAEIRALMHGGKRGGSSSDTSS